MRLLLKDRKLNERPGAHLDNYGISHMMVYLFVIDILLILT